MMKFLWPVLLLLPCLAFAHDGELDTLGCHHDKKTESYHCHRGPMAGMQFRSKNEALEAIRHSGDVPQHAPQNLPVPVTLTGRASVIGGDTLEIHGQRIRLHGIDAPESSQRCRTRDGKLWRCGQKAALALSDKIGTHTVSCTGKDIDRYKRIVAACNMAGEDLGEWLVLNGWAVAYRLYSYEYTRAEQMAKSARRGIWQGEFVMPWKWRRGERLPVPKISTGKTDKPASEDCRIKGNISKRGTRIYHVPGGKFYDRTRIDESQGEMWFCSEAEARAAGWRRSKR